MIINSPGEGSRTMCFIGSSSEGLAHARALQSALEATKTCWVDSWTYGVFEASGYPIDSLIAAAERADFAILVGTPDDVTESRGVKNASPRDNIIFELGLFMGVLGRRRTYVLSTAGGDLRLPSDLQGLTRLGYDERPDNNLAAGMNTAVEQVTSRIRELGSRARGTPAEWFPSAADVEPLTREVGLLCSNAVDQGWKVRTNSATTLRIVSPGGKSFVLTKSVPSRTRVQLRAFVAQLRGHGLRVNDSIRRPVRESPLS